MVKKSVVQGLERLRDDIHQLGAKLVDEYIIEDYKKGELSDKEIEKFFNKLEKDMMSSFARMRKKL